jgi:hypothetical protein
MRLKPSPEGTSSARIPQSECDANNQIHAELVTAPKGTSALAHHVLLPSVRGGYFFMLPKQIAENTTDR